MQEWSDGVRIAMDVIIGCVIISAIIVCMSIGKNIMRVMDVQQAAANDVQEYRVVAMYQGTDVYPQDVVNLVITNHGVPYVEVHRKGGTLHKWTSDSTPNNTAYTSAAIGNLVGNSSMYTCELDYDINNQLIGYIFTER